MSFWDSELGAVTGNAEDAFAKSFKQIPDGTMALARIVQFNNAAHEGVTYLNIEWELTAGDFKSQKVNQKIKAFDSDSKVKHRALNMLKLIYQLYSIKPAHANPPTDLELALFVGKVAGIKIRETEPNEKTGRQYNWVSEIHKEAGFKCETGIKLEVKHVNVQQTDLFDNAFSRNKNQPAALDDDIPF